MSNIRTPNNCTIWFNDKASVTTNKAKYTKVRLNGVKFDFTKSYNTNLTGQVNTDKARVIIYLNSVNAFIEDIKVNFIENYNFINLSEEDKKKYWTVNEEDYFMLDLIGFDGSIAELKSKYKNLFYTVRSLDLIVTSKRLRHIEINGR